MDISTVSQENWLTNEELYLQQLENDVMWNSIPLLNANDVNSIKDTSLVRFRGMVQDMYDPEYYYEKYEVFNTISNTKSIKSAKYCDGASCKENEEIKEESSRNVLAERHTFVVISAPGENMWVENTNIEKYKTEIPKKVSNSQTQSKRPLEACESMETDENERSIPSTDPKKQCTENPSPSTSNTSNNPSQNVASLEHILNFPLPTSKGKVCHLKLYKEPEDIKLNDFCEFIGFISLDPLLQLEARDDFENAVETQTHHPPASLVPRVHCVKWKKLGHNNPLVEDVNVGFSQEKMQFLKKELLIVLTQLLLGDSVAAEYLLYHLVSSVYIRKDFLAIGKFSLNISNIPKFEHCDYVQELYSFIEQLVPQSYYFPMTLDNMNTLGFIPKKDYECNRLTSGLLQLSPNTQFVIDETKLQAGKLNEMGIKAINALAKAIKTQTVQYDFGFGTVQEFHCDIPFLVFSEGKSMLPSDYHIPLKPDEVCLNTFKEITEAAKHFLNPQLLNDIRVFLTLARIGKYDIGDDIQEKIQNEFVLMRQRQNVTGDDLHQLLVCTRLASLTEGKNTVDDDCWKKACDLEAQRKLRSANK